MHIQAYNAINCNMFIHLNPVKKKKALGKAVARPTPRLGLGWAGSVWERPLPRHKNEAPDPTLQNSETQRHGGPKQAKSEAKRKPSRDCYV